MTEVLLNPQRLVVGFCRLKPVAQRKEHTVRVRGMETGISETSKRVSIFDRETTLKREGSDPAAWSRA